MSADQQRSHANAIRFPTRELNQYNGLYLVSIARDAVADAAQPVLDAHVDTHPKW
jgi:hypothetical protein